MDSNAKTLILIIIIILIVLIIVQCSRNRNHQKHRNFDHHRTRSGSSDKYKNRHPGESLPDRAIHPRDKKKWKKRSKKSKSRGSGSRSKSPRSGSRSRDDELEPQIINVVGENHPSNNLIVIFSILLDRPGSIEFEYGLASNQNRKYITSDEISDSYSIEITKLKPDSIYDYSVNSQVTGQFQTGALINGLESVQINPNDIRTDFNIVTVSNTFNGLVAFDQDGDIVWYCDFQNKGPIGDIVAYNYDNVNDVVIFMTKSYISIISLDGSEMKRVSGIESFTGMDGYHSVSQINGDLTSGKIYLLGNYLNSESNITDTLDGDIMPPGPFPFALDPTPLNITGIISEVIVEWDLNSNSNSVAWDCLDTFNPHETCTTAWLSNVSILNGTTPGEHVYRWMDINSMQYKNDQFILSSAMQSAIIFLDSSFNLLNILSAWDGSNDIDGVELGGGTLANTFSGFLNNPNDFFYGQQDVYLDDTGNISMYDDQINYPTIGYPNYNLTNPNAPLFNPDPVRAPNATNERFLQLSLN